MPIAKFDKYTSVFVETGSYLGHGIQKALDAGYDKVISIEFKKNHYDFCVDRFWGNSKVTMVHGDSSEELASVIASINEPITFWLDGHFSENDRKEGVKLKYLSPLIQELQAIAKHPVKGHVILIDDVACWDGYENIFHSGFNTDTLKDELRKINPDYVIYYMDGCQEDGTVMTKDIMIAK